MHPHLCEGQRSVSDVFLYGSPPPSPPVFFFFFFTEPSAYQLGRLVGHQALGVGVSLTRHSGYRYAPPNTGSSCFLAGTLPTEPSPQPRFKYQI